MGKHMNWIFWIVFGIAISKTSGKNCSKPFEHCLRCDETGIKCMKCKHFLVLGTRNCVLSCPMGYIGEWSTYDDYMGRICVETSFIASFGFTGETSAVLVGSLTGFILCLGALLGGYIYIRRRRIKALATLDENSDSTMIMTPLHQQERSEFLRELSLLRHEAPVFLSMLNETRRQVREIYKTKSSANKRETAIAAYRPVLRDLYIILVLLNKPEEKIATPPQDWKKLFSWGERVLKRYKRQNNLGSPVDELVNFLQVPEPNLTGSRVSLFQPYSTLSTVSTNTLTSTVSRKLRNVINHKSDITETTHEDFLLNMSDRVKDFQKVYQVPPSKGDVYFRTLNRFSFVENNFDNWDENHTILAEWSANNDFSFEDDFIRLGFRPQDEITTEL